MRIQVQLKHPGNLTKKIQAIPMELPAEPHTLRNLIEACVEVCVTAYRERAKAAKTPAPLTDEAFAGMEELGKFAFGVHYNENRIDPRKAAETAVQAVEDGIVRVFLEQDELTDMDGAITVPEDASVTFVRLTMLSGRMW